MLRFNHVLETLQSKPLLVKADISEALIRLAWIDVDFELRPRVQFCLLAKFSCFTICLLLQFSCEVSFVVNLAELASQSVTQTALSITPAATSPMVRTDANVVEVTKLAPSSIPAIFGDIKMVPCTSSRVLDQAQSTLKIILSKIALLTQGATAEEAEITIKVC